jgi:cyclopropane fatty-acyl-phospholipid synthase-like methyltransferase
MRQETFLQSGPEIATVLELRDSSCARDLYIAAVSWLDLFTTLDAQPTKLSDLCVAFNLQERPARTMLRLFESWNLLVRSGDQYGVTPQARRYLSRRSDENVVSYIATMKYKSSVREMYEVLREGQSDTWHVERTGTTSWDDLMQTDDFAALNTQGMEERGRIFAPSLAELLDCSTDRQLLDIGGGSGVYCAHLLMRFPSLEAIVIERPPVDELARACLRQRGLLGNRASVLAGDMFVDPFPENASLHLYSHVLHNWSPAKVQHLLNKSHQHLPAGGRVAIYSCHPDDRNGRPAPAKEAEYSVLLTASYEGLCYSVSDMEAMFAKAGFVDVNYRRSICNRSLLTARKRVS